MSYCETQGLAIGYGAPLLRDISLQAERGRILAFIGPNGAGKSTLLKTLAGQLAAQSGAVLLDGKTLTTYTPNARARKLALMLPHMARTELTTCFDVAAAGRYPYTGRLGILSDEDKQQVRDALHLVQADELAARDFTKISDGQRQRVLLARAVCQQPEILLLDEPLGALDLKLRKEMQLELKRLQREMNITFIYVTHDQEEALTMSDTVVVMNGGKVQQIGTPEDIYNEPKNAFVADFIGDSNIVDGVMHKDFLVSFSGVDFPCVDRGFAREQSVQVVVRPEDIEVVSPVEGQLVGVVNDVIFKGVHFEMHVECEGREWLIHSTRACTPGETIGMRIGPNEIHIMARSEG